MIYPINYVNQIKQKMCLHSKYHAQSIYYANVNVNLIEENVIQINGWIMTNVDVNVKKSFLWQKLS